MSQPSSTIIAKFQEKSFEMSRRKSQTSNIETEKEIDIQEHLMTREEIESKFTTTVSRGLDSVDAKERHERLGPNTLTPPAKVPEWVKFMRTQTGFFSLLLWGGAILCFISYGIAPENVDNLYLGVVLAVVVLLTGVFSYMQDAKSEALMNSFANFLPEKTVVLRDGNKIAIEAIELVPGDIVFVKGGDKIPADIRCIAVDNFKVDNSSLTGESEPQKRRVEVDTEDNALESKNIAFYGTLAQEGKCTGMVIRIGDNTVIGKIAKLTQEGGDVQTPIAIEIEHFIRIVGAVAVGLGLVFLVIALAVKFGVIDSLVFMIGIIVANVPEGLLATVTVALTLTAKTMAEKQVLVKNLESVETLGSTTVIASDKTGTLTQNRMTVAHVWYDGKVVLAHGFGESSYDPSNSTFKVLQKVGTLCNNAIFFDDDENKLLPVLQRQTEGDASESAFIKFFHPITDILKLRGDNEKLAEIPFKSANKYQVSIHLEDNDASKDRLFVMKGAPERIWARCSHVLVKGERVPREEYLQNYNDATRSLMMGGERVLGCAYNTLPASDYPVGFEFNTEDGEENFPLDGLCFVGLISLIDPPRAAVPKAVLNCQSAGIKVIMVTGDHPDTAEAIAKQVNIIRDKTRRDLAMERNCDIEDIDPSDPEIKALVITGKELETFDDATLDAVLDYEQIVFARTSPQQKHQIVSGLQAKTFIKRGHAPPGKPVKHVVAVTGDGVNDSPALKLADIGIAMGIAGSDVAKQAADMILLDDNFASIVNGVEEGRLIFDNLKKSIAYTLSSNIPELTPFLFFIILQIPLALPTVLILFIDLGTDMIPAISFAYEKKEADIMKKPPRDARVDRLVTLKLIFFAYLQIGVIQALAGFYSYFVVLNDFGFSPSFLIGRGIDFEDWRSDYERSLCPFDAEYATTFASQYSDCILLDSNNNVLAELDGGQCEFESDSACRDPGKALTSAQTAFFVSIVIVQWADGLICKTRSLSIREQGMSNWIFNMGLVSETLLAILLVYVPFLNNVGTTSLRFVHLLPSLPFAVLIVVYDEVRKYLLRNMGKNNWVMRNTYY